MRRILLNEEHPAITKPYLLELYVSFGLSGSQISKIIGTSNAPVFAALHHYGINVKPAVTPKGSNSGSNNHFWKGSKAGYAAGHHRMRRLYGRPQECDQCGTTDPNKRYDWANMSGRYLDTSDYKRLCRSCHNTLDRGRGPFLQAARKRHADIIKLYEDGAYIHEIAGKFNTTKKNVESIIERARRRGVSITRKFLIRRCHDGVVRKIDNSNHI